MGTLTSLSDLINRATGGNSGTPEHLFWWKDQRVGSAAMTAPAAGQWTSLWQINGSPSGASSTAPGAVANPTNATDGALKQTDAGGGRQKWLIGGTAACAGQGSFMIYDRLLHGSGLNGTLTSAQSFSGSVTRYTSTESIGNAIFIEIYSIIGSTSTTVTVNYTDQDGNAATTLPVAFGGTTRREAQRMIMCPLAVGGTGVRGITSVTAAASTGAAGDFGVTVARPLLSIPINAAGSCSVRDLVTGLPGPIEIKSGACLSLAWFAGSTTVTLSSGSLHFVEA